MQRCHGAPKTLASPLQPGVGIGDASVGLLDAPPAGPAPSAARLQKRREVAALAQLGGSATRSHRRACPTAAADIRCATSPDPRCAHRAQRRSARRPRPPSAPGQNHTNASRTTSACPSSRTPRTTSPNVILSTPATSGASYSSNRGTSDDHERRGGRTYNDPSDAVLHHLHHATGRDPANRSSRRASAASRETPSPPPHRGLQHGMTAGGRGGIRAPTPASLKLTPKLSQRTEQ